MSAPQPGIAAGTTLDEFYDKVSTTMPLNAPGTLRPAIAADILAFLLKENNFPAGSKDLGSEADALKTISFDVFKPKPALAAKVRHNRTTQLSGRRRQRAPAFSAWVSARFRPRHRPR